MRRPEKVKCSTIEKILIHQLNDLIGEVQREAQGNVRKSAPNELAKKYATEIVETLGSFRLNLGDTVDWDLPPIVHEMRPQSIIHTPLQPMEKQ